MWITTLKLLTVVFEHSVSTELSTSYPQVIHIFDLPKRLSLKFLR